MRCFLHFKIIMILIAICASCSSHTVPNNTDRGIVFTDIKSDYTLNDMNNYGCKPIGLPVLEHIFKNGTFVTEKDLHDQYSTTGCTIKGRVKINNRTNEFIYDYGGIVYLSNGKILGCAQGCCREDYPNCSWDKKNLKGF